MIIALAQINSSLGDFEGNALKIQSYLEEAKRNSAELVVFPEAALFGYHPFDLLERDHLVKLQLKFLNKIHKKMPRDLVALVGCFTINPSKRGRPFFNSAALLQKGKPIKFFSKQLLPTGDVFDEARFIEPGSVLENHFKLGNKNILVTICEDIWAWPLGKKRNIYTENPISKIKGKYDLVINMSASPFYPEKLKLRQNLVKATAKHFKSPMLYVNMVGGQDEIIFDGQSFVLDKHGKIFYQAQSFREELGLLDLSKSSCYKFSPKDKTEEIRQAVVLGIRDFCRKTKNQCVHLGVSGGVDSAVVAALAVEALGPDRVKGLYMPSKYSSDLSQRLAYQLCENLKVELIKLDLSQIIKNFQDQISSAFFIEGVAVENLQARLRSVCLMAYSNSKNSLLLSTSNKSEIACGYTTLYGDMSGGLAPIGDLVKEQIYDLARCLNSKKDQIPEEIITRAPTAELRENQTDQDSLPPYDDLDPSVVKIVEKCQQEKTEVDRWLLKQIMKFEFKRFQSPPILKVSSHSFGRGRRYPIAKF